MDSKYNNRYLGKLSRLGIGLLLSVNLFWNGLSHAVEVPIDVQIKVAYLYNFLQFVQWPVDALGTGNMPICICLLGQDSLYGFAYRLRERSVAGRSIEVVQLRHDADLRLCHIAYVGQTSAQQIAGILQRTPRLPILTVSDVQGFTKQGGIVGLVSSDNKVHLEINLAAAQAARLHISAKLLEVAKIVE